MTYDCLKKFESKRLANEEEPQIRPDPEGDLFSSGNINNIMKDYKASIDAKRAYARKNRHWKQSINRVDSVHPESPIKADINTIKSGSEKYKKSKLLKPKLSDHELYAPIRKRSRQNQLSSHGDYKCNALVNSNRCICDPSVCLSKESTKKRNICFCVKSFKRGEDGFTYHTSCNCVGAQKNL